MSAHNGKGLGLPEGDLDQDGEKLREPTAIQSCRNVERERQLTGASLESEGSQSITGILGPPAIQLIIV